MSPAAKLLNALRNCDYRAVQAYDLIVAMKCSPHELRAIFFALQHAMETTREMDYSLVQNYLEDADKALDDCYAVTLEDRAAAIKAEMRNED